MAFEQVSLFKMFDYFCQKKYRKIERKLPESNQCYHTSADKPSRSSYRVPESGKQTRQCSSKTKDT